MSRLPMCFAVLACAATFCAFAQDADAPLPDPVPSGTFYVSVPARRADEAKVVARVERGIGTARLLGTRSVRGRHGAHVVFVFEKPKSWWKSDAWFAKFLAKTGRAFGGAGAEVMSKPAADGISPDVLRRSGVTKGKPVTTPIFDSDFDRNPVNAASVRTQPALAQTSAPAAQQKARGAGRIVAVLDGGFDLRHPFLAGHMLPGYDAIDDDADAQDLGNGRDDDGDGVVDRCVGHGTFVASIVLAVAPDALVLPVRVLDDETWGTDVSVAAGISYALDHGASVINMSLVLPSASQVVKDAVRSAVNQGVVIVSAAGTTDDDWQNDPYLRDRAICVGAVDGDDVIPDWSQSGASVHVFAPGVWPVGAIGGAAHPGSYGAWSGVSFAVPFLAGGAAMIREIHPPSDWTIFDVKNRLMGTADTAYDAADDPHPKRGRVDLDRAVPAR